MGLKDIFNKSVDMIKSGVQDAKKAAEDKKNAIQEFEFLKTKSTHISPMQPFKIHNENPQPGIEQLILTTCVNISLDQAKIVNQIIPVEETIVNIKLIREAVTEMEYILIITNQKVWIVNQKEFITYNFEDIKTFKIINKGLTAQSVDFNGNAFVITGKDDEIEMLGNIILNKDYRKTLIDLKTKYLCGVTPKKQILNLNMKGITIGENKNIVLHNTPDNKLISLNDIAYLQLLMNDSVVLVKGKPGVDQGTLVSSPIEARKMSVKVVLSMGEYIIETMPTGMMNKSYKREDSVYINNYEYAKKIVDALTDLVEENRKTSYKTSKDDTSIETFSLE